MGAGEVQAFLSALATERRVSASTQNQALAALLFLYREVLGIELPWLNDLVRAKPRQRLPVVLSRNEVQRLLDRLEGTHGLMARLMYGTGMRLMECVTLRVKDHWHYLKRNYILNQQVERLRASVCYHAVVYAVMNSLRRISLD